MRNSGASTATTRFDTRRSSTLADVSTRSGDLNDVPAVVAMHARCTGPSLFRRFHAPLPRISARLARQLLAPTCGWSMVAERGGQVVALACVAPLSASVAEAGLLVEDSHQRQGIGTRMLYELALQTAARGYEDLQLLAQPENERVLATVLRAGLRGRIAWHDGVLRVTVPVGRVGPRRLARPA